MDSKLEQNLQKFTFAKGPLLLIVGVGLGVGLFGIFSEPSIHGRFGTPLGLLIFRGLGILSFGVGLFHFPNLLRAFLRLPAITIDASTLHIHQFPTRVIPLKTIGEVQWERGSLLLKLECGRRKWLNLKIVQNGRCCADAVESRLRRGGTEISTGN
jgi:hypothetical protein